VRIGLRGLDAFGKSELINPNLSGIRNFYVQLGTAYLAFVTGFSSITSFELKLGFLIPTTRIRKPKIFLGFLFDSQRL
jgi:hypothetical protein